MRTLLFLLCSVCYLNAQNPLGMVGDWPFDGNAQDMSGNGNHGTVNGATPTFDRFGQPNKAYRFDGISSKIVVPHSSSINMANNQNFSFAIWMKAYAGNVSKVILSKHINGFWNGYCFWVNNQTDPGYCMSAHHLMFYTASGAMQDACSDNPVVNDTSWHFIVGVRDAAMNKSYLYVDAVLQADVGMSSGNLSNTANLGFGYDANANINFFNGVLDGARMYNRMLTAGEISTLYFDCPDGPLAPGGSGKEICKNTMTTLVATGTGTISWYASATATNAIGAGPNFNTPVLQPGVYTYYAELMNVCGTSPRTAMSVTVSACTGLIDRSGQIAAFEMYPNPSNGSFMLKMEQVAEGMQLRIVNQLGQEVYTASLQHPETLVDTELPAGVYTTNIYYKDKPISTKKLVVQQ